VSRLTFTLETSMRTTDLARQLAKLARHLAAIVDRLVEERPPDPEILGLPPMETAIIESLANGDTMIAKKIAKASGYAYCSRLRAVLADLCRRNLIVNGPDGYKLAPRGTTPILPSSRNGYPPTSQAVPSRLNGTNGHAAKTE
jgi:hypothetical protein